MDDLRWTLLLAGAIAVAAIYFSGRFESEDWTRERKQLSKKKAGDKGKKFRRKKLRPENTKAPASADVVIKKEPLIDLANVESTVQPSIQPSVQPIFSDEPSVTELQVESAVTRSESSTKDTPDIDVTEIVPEAIVDEELFVENKAETAEVGHGGIEDEIIRIEIPAELEVAEAEIQVSATESDQAPVKTEASLDVEPLVLSVIVLADDDETFAGLEIKEALEAEGLVHGEMQIFHFCVQNKNDVSENADAVFSVANMLEPGFFDLEKLNDVQTSGLILFCQLPGPLSGEVALDMMLDKGRGLAVRLHGQMCDDKRNRFTTQAKNHYLDQVSTLNRELVLAHSKTPEN